MANNRITNLRLSFTKRIVPKAGPNTSDTWNDTVTELSQDLTQIISEWDNKLLPLFLILPDGTVDVDVDAFNNGLDGKTFFVDASATSSLNTSYFNSTYSRPNTVLEQFEVLQDYVNTSYQALQTNLTELTFSAKNIPIIDANALYDATNVEDALQEVMLATAQVNNHNSLTHLSDNDHPQYLLRDGTNAMEEDFNGGGNDINNIATVNAITGTFSGTVTADHFSGLESIVNVTTTTPVAISTPSDTSYFITAAASLTLPNNPAIGTNYWFYGSIANANLKVIPYAGQTIWDSGTGVTTSLYTSSIWATLWIVCIDTNTWITKRNNGWSVT
jgi:hypothetical protein